MKCACGMQVTAAMDECLNCGRPVAVTASKPVRTTTARKAPARTPAARKAAPRKASTARKPVARKTAVRKPVPRKTTAPAAKKPTARKAGTTRKSPAPRTRTRPEAPLFVEPLPRTVEEMHLAPDALPDDVRNAAAETSEARADRADVVKLAVFAIALSAGAMFLPRFAGLDTSGTMTSRLGVGAVITVALYAAVVFFMRVRLRDIRVRPKVVEGDPARAIVMGLLVGGGVGLVLSTIVSLVAGGVTSDKRFLLVIGEGSGWQIFVIVGIGLIAAPLVEEFLFRGLLVESFRSRGRSSAIAVGAVAFAFWHVNPSALRYYFLVGFLLGYMYWRFGLTGSIATHFAFNGVLTAFAFIAIGTTSVIAGSNGVTATVPGGWSRAHVSGAQATDLAAESVGGAGLIVEHIDRPQVFGVPTASALPPDATNARPVQVAGSPAIRYDTVKNGHAAEIVLVPRGHRGYSIVFVPEQSNRSKAQFEDILNKLVLPAT